MVTQHRQELALVAQNLEKSFRSNYSALTTVGGSYVTLYRDHRTFVSNARR
jgi:hypothetical protein